MLLMRNAFAFFEWDLGGCDLDFLVDLDRVAVDDLAVELECDFDSECAFSGGSGPDDRNDRIMHERV